MKVSLVATVKDAGEHIAEFLESVRAQTRLPDEIVVVDGGSTDGTLDVLRAASDVTLIAVPGANIPRGRNLAIEAATHDVIAITDADCLVGPAWLEHLVATLEDGADVALGLSRPIATTFLQACAAGIGLPEADEIDPSSYMPSSRSLGIRREAFEAAGRYPEWLDVGEDMYLNHRLREQRLDMRFAPDAVAYWRIRPTLAATWRQYARYARGDAEARMYPKRHALRFGVYCAVALTVLGGRRLPRVGLAVAASVYAAPRVRRARRLLRGHPARQTAAVAAVPLLMAFIDVAKMAGYLGGRLAGRRGS